MNKEEKSYEVKYDLVVMNVIGVIYTLILVFILYLMFKHNFLTGKFDITTETLSQKNLIIFLITFYFWFVLHEIIHGIFYIIGGAKREYISYGCVIEKGLLYCKCNNNITKKNAMISLLAPFTIIGVITLIISFLIGDFTLLILSVCNLSGACADLCVFIFFLKLGKDLKFREVGDTSTFVLTTKEDLTKRKILGIKSFRLLKEDELPVEKVKQKITITKISKYFIIAMIILIVGAIILEIIQ